MNRIDLGGRAAVVTGGARGIGFACAERMKASGAALSLWDRDGAALSDAAARLGGAHTVTMDVADEASVGAAAEAAIRALGKIDILVNNAGITGPNKTTWNYTPAEWRQVLEIDLTGAFLAARALVPHMMGRKYGRIINMASVAGKEGNPNAPAYSAAKAGLIALTKSLGKELASTGITVNCVTPAAARTDLFAQMTQAHIDYMLSRIPMGRFVEPQEIAALVAWLASEDCSFSTGAVFDITGGRSTY
ncbi:MAG TPA: SDR family NAD(P)-dependent oxidoreductase [Stellaceae bacterium]|nr:SDR family NAD(P)-dependent oxidoreductase [Stellaceae bacterium]